MRKYLHIILKGYFLISGLLVLAYLFYGTLNFAAHCFPVKVSENCTVLGHIKRPYVGGLENIIIVGWRVPNKKYPKGDPYILGELTVDELNKYPIDSKVTYTYYQYRFLGYCW